MSTTTWIGSISTDWALAGNWSNGVPTTGMDMSVNVSATNLWGYSTIPSATLVLGNIDMTNHGNDLPPQIGSTGWVKTNDTDDIFLNGSYGDNSIIGTNTTLLGSVGNNATIYGTVGEQYGAGASTGNNAVLYGNAYNSDITDGAIVDATFTSSNIIGNTFGDGLVLQNNAYTSGGNSFGSCTIDPSCTLSELESLFAGTMTLLGSSSTSAQVEYGASTIAEGFCLNVNMPTTTMAEVARAFSPSTSPWTMVWNTGSGGSFVADNATCSLANVTLILQSDIVLGLGAWETAGIYSG